MTTDVDRAVLDVVEVVARLARDGDGPRIGLERPRLRRIQETSRTAGGAFGTDQDVTSSSMHLAVFSIAQS